MKLTKYKLGDLIKLVDEKNDSDIKNFYGININKEFMPTSANTTNLDEKKYKVVRKNRFVFSGMQTGRDKCIRISLFSCNNPIIVSPAYTTFEIKNYDIIIPEYLFMLFLTKEKDRLGWFYSDSSIRSNLDWDRFCDIDITLPPIDIQQKYVDIYKGMLENQKSYETGLEDLKLTCDAYVDRLKYENLKPLSEIFEEIDVRNSKQEYSIVKGIDISKSLIDTKADLSKADLSKYKILNTNQFTFSGMQTGRDRCIRIAMLSDELSVLITPAYNTFKINKNINSRYVMIYFLREEMDRVGWFMSDSSVRANLDLDRFYEIKISVPPIEIQNAIADIYTVYKERKNINEKLKEQLKDICPILIKGSIEEARKG